MAVFIGGFIACAGTKNGKPCRKLHTVEGAASTLHGCPNCGHDIREQAWRNGRTVADTTSNVNW